MALSSVNFNLVTPYIDLDVRDFPVVLAGTNMPTTLGPNDADVMRDGEFLSLTPAYKMQRSNQVAAAGNPSALPELRQAYVMYAERGRTDIQAAGKLPFIYRGTFEADTKLFLDANLDNGNLIGDSTAGTGLFTVGMPVVVCKGKSAYNTAYAKYSVLAGLKSGIKGFVMGYVTRPPEKNGTRGLRVYCQAGGYGIQTV